MRAEHVVACCLFIAAGVGSAPAPCVAGPGAPGLKIVLDAKLAPSDAGNRDSFSSSVDISGDTMVSSSREDDNENGEDAGAAYVYERDPVTREWAEVAKLLALDGAEHDYYGESAAIGGDVIAIGTDRRRAVYLYERDEGGPGAWGHVAKLEALDGAPGTEFGWEVDLTPDGSRLAVTALGKPDGEVGSVYIFDRDVDGVWTESAQFGPSDGLVGDSFGFGLGITDDGMRLVVSAYLADEGRGKAYIFDDDGSGNWTETAILTASDANLGDGFGIAVSIHDDTAVLGAAHDSDLALKTGSAYVFERDLDDSWVEVAKLVPFDFGPKAFFGRCVANLGDIVTVAAPGDDDLAPAGGASYVFRRNEGGPGAWGFSYKMNGGDSIEKDRYAYSLAMDGDSLIVGSDRDAEDAGFTSGTLYAYTIFQGANLSVVGSCPGTIAIEIVGAVPDSRLQLAVAAAEGEFVLPGGECAGTTLALGRPRLLRPVDVDGSGDAVLVGGVGATMCGRKLQAFDLSNCLVTNVATIP